MGKKLCSPLCCWSHLKDCEFQSQGKDHSGTRWPLSGWDPKGFSKCWQPVPRDPWTGGGLWRPALLLLPILTPGREKWKCEGRQAAGSSGACVMNPTTQAGPAPPWGFRHHPRVRTAYWFVFQIFLFWNKTIKMRPENLKTSRVKPTNILGFF